MYYNILPHFANQFMKGIFPCVHLYNSHSTDNFVHDSNPLICKRSTFQPRTRIIILLYPLVPAAWIDYYKDS